MSRAGAPRIAALALCGLILSQSFAAAQWAADGVPVCTNSSGQFVNTITSDSQGGAISCWTDSRNGASDIYAQRCNAAGMPLWTVDGIPVCNATGSQQTPVSLPFSGGAIVVWSDGRNGSSDVYAQRISSSGAPQWATNGVALGTESYNDVGMAIIHDGSSGVIVPAAYYVAWRQADSGHYAVALQRVNVDGEGLWTTPAAGGVILSEGTSQKFTVALTTDGGSLQFLSLGAVVAWVDAGAPFSLFAQRVNPAGVPQWAAGGILVCPFTSVKSEPALVQVGGNQEIIVWADNRPGNGQTDLYVQKLDGTGNRLWTSSGVPLCQATGNQYAIRILRDNAGGAFVAWVDTRDFRIYAQRVNGNGQSLWTSGGIPLHTVGPVNNNSLNIAPDAASGGFFAAWSDYRAGSSNPNVYAQRVDPNGNLLWAPEGALLCGAPDKQEFPRICPGSPGGAIVAWWDLRTETNYDVYANTFGAGATDAPRLAVGAPLLTLVSGNPTRGAARFQLQLPGERSVAMDVRDVAGRRVRSIANGRLRAGTHALAWDGVDDSGVRVGSGVYFVRLTAGEESRTSRVVVVR